MLIEGIFEMPLFRSENKPRLTIASKDRTAAYRKWPDIDAIMYNGGYLSIYLVLDDGKYLCYSRNGCRYHRVVLLNPASACIVRLSLWLYIVLTLVPT